MAEPRIRILLVDDDEEDFLITSEVIYDIQEHAFQVDWRDSFAGAVAALDTEKYDVLVFDYRLGADNGIDLLRHVVERGYPAPVIMLTGQQGSDIDNEALRLGAADYLIKGKITPDTFERAVRHAIEKHRTLAQLRGSNAFLQSIIDAIPAALAILDADGIITTVNEAWRTRFGAETARSIGASYAQWPEGSEPEELPGRTAFDQGIRGILAGDASRFNIDSPLSSGGICQWVQCAATAFLSTGDVYAVVAYEDITARKLAEQQLQKSRERLQELSIRDELTGTYNRRYFGTVIQDELARSRRYNKPFAVLMLDIDHFKSVNDTYGHQVGDAALQHVARLARAGCRTSDLVARHGGEEFAFILPETGIEEARQFAERIRQAIEDAPLQISPADSATSLALTASLGIAVFPAEGETAEALLDFADKGLYLAKRQGRNRVCHAAE